MWVWNDQDEEDVHDTIWALVGNGDGTRASSLRTGSAQGESSVTVSGHLVPGRTRKQWGGARGRGQGPGRGGGQGGGVSAAGRGRAKPSVQLGGTALIGVVDAVAVRSGTPQRRRGARTGAARLATTRHRGGLPPLVMPMGRGLRRARSCSCRTVPPVEVPAESSEEDRISTEARLPAGPLLPPEKSRPLKRGKHEEQGPHHNPHNSPLDDKRIYVCISLVSAAHRGCQYQGSCALPYTWEHCILKLPSDRVASLVHGQLGRVPLHHQ
jgi:hypothetical protein